MCESSLITHAADLAERLVEQISEADHDWREVQRRALALARLAARAQSAERGAAGSRPRDPPRSAAASRPRDPRRSVTC